MKRSIIFGFCSMMATMLFSWDGSAQAPSKPTPYKNVGPDEFEKLAKQPKHVILDVRTAKEFAAEAEASIPATQLPLN